MKEKILIALCGMSPAVISETIFALHKEHSWQPDKVIIVTTTLGKQHIETDLFESNIWKKLKHSLNLKTEFSNSAYHIRLIPNSDATGNADDIITSIDNDRTADFLLEVLREFTENPDTEIIFSIAGGRKTMSAIGSMTMSLLGRENDRMCHVLVSPPFDSPALKPKFFFPQKALKHIAPDGITYESTNAVISLAFIPFVNIRYLFQKEFNKLPGSFKNIVQLANKRISGRISPPDIKLIPERMELFINNKLIKLNCAEFTMYWMLAELAKNSLPPIYGQTILLDEYIDFISDIKKSRMPEIINHITALKRKNTDDIRRIISILTQKIKNNVSIENGREAAIPKISRGVYAISAPPDFIIIL